MPLSTEGRSASDLEADRARARELIELLERILERCHRFLDETDAALNEAERSTMTRLQPDCRSAFRTRLVVSGATQAVEWKPASVE